MLKKCNNVDLQEKGVDPKYYLIYQVWKELTHSKTLDTYQFRVMNTLSALKELANVITQHLEGYSKGLQNIKDCKIETNRLIKSDSVLQKHFPAIYYRLLSHFNEHVETESQQKVLLYQLEYVLRILEPQYFNLLIGELEHDIENRNVEHILTETNQLVSCCVSLGWSNSALFQVIDTLQGSQSESSAWDRLKDKLCMTSFDEYHILLPFNIRPITFSSQTNEEALERVLEEIRRLDIEPLSKEQVQERYSTLSGKNLGEEYLLSTVLAKDVYSASQKAISKFAEVFNILSFYGKVEPWNIRDISWIGINVSNEYVRNLKSKDLYGTYDYMDSANKLFRISKELDNSADQSVRTRLRAAYSYANIGKVSYSPTEKYINMWVALESLCHTETSENIIEGIQKTVSPALCIRYIYRCFRNFAEDCVRCNIRTEGINWRNPSKESLVVELMDLMNNSEQYQEFHELCKTNELLLIRCEEMHTLATDENKMYERIESHYQNVKLQLSRLYRLRNEIVHSALNEEDSIIRYIEHLNDYLVGFVAEVVLCWEKNQQSSIENILAHCKMKLQ